MDILAIGHSMVVDTNRKIWDECGAMGNDVDLVIPADWNSNLFKKYQFKNNVETDSHIKNIYAQNVFLNGNASVYFFNPLKLWKILNTKKYDFVYVHQESWAISFFWISLLMRFGKNKNTKLLLWINQNIYKKKFWWVEYLERFNMRRCDIVLGCNTESEQVLLKKKIKTKWKYYPYSFDENIFYTPSKLLKNNNLNIGYIGRLTEEKGLDDILEVFFELKQKYNINLIIAGGGTLEDKISQTTGITFLGKIKHQEVMQFYRDVDILLLPSKTREFWKEQFGRVLIEAAASRISVIGSNSGAIPEVMGQLEMPYNFDETNISDFQDKLEKCIQAYQTGAVKETIDKAQKNSLEKFSHRSVMKYLLGIVCEN